MVGVYGILAWSCFQIPLSCVEQWFYQGRVGCKDLPAASLPEGVDLIDSKFGKIHAWDIVKTRPILVAINQGMPTSQLAWDCDTGWNKQQTDQPEISQEDLGNMTAIMGFDKLPHILGDMEAA